MSKWKPTQSVTVGAVVGAGMTALFLMLPDLGLALSAGAAAALTTFAQTLTNYFVPDKKPRGPTE